MTAPAPGANGEGRRKPRRAPSRATLEPEASAALREQLLADLAGLAGPKELDRWAQSCLPTKNTLTATDARLVEEAFQGKLAVVGPAHAAAIEVSPLSPAPSQPDHGTQQTAQTHSEPNDRIDKSVLAFPELPGGSDRTGTRGRRLYFRRSSWVALSDGPNNTARWARHRPTSSNRYRLTARLLVNPLEHRGL